METIDLTRVIGGSSWSDISCEVGKAGLPLALAGAFLGRSFVHARFKTLGAVAGFVGGAEVSSRFAPACLGVLQRQYGVGVLP